MNENDQNAPSSSPRPPRQARKGLTSTGARKAASKSTRSRSREFALQALYQYILSGNSATEIDLFTRDLAGFHKADAAHYDALLHGCIEAAEQLNALGSGGDFHGLQLGSEGSHSVGGIWASTECAIKSITGSG